MDSNKRSIFFYCLGGITFTIFLIFVVFQFDSFMGYVDIMLDAFMPFLIGLVIAFILNTIVKLFENHVFKYFNTKFEKGKVWNKIRRPITMLISYLVLIALVCVIIFFIIPDLGSSIELFVNTAKTTVPLYAKEFGLWLNQVIIDYDLNINVAEIQNLLFSNFEIGTIMQNLSSMTTDLFNSLVAATINLASGVMTVFFSIVYSIYFLSDKEKHILRFKKIIYAYLPRRKANNFSMFLRLSNKVFSNYVRGQTTECVILGTLCYIGMSIIGLDYALLISTIVTMSALIPLLGAYIALGLGAVLLLMVNPMDSLWFIIFFVILQQFEGNVIYPKVVGSSLGLPEVWTLTSVMVFGGLFGIPGIIVGPPTFAVAYILLKYHAEKKLSVKDIGENVLNGSEVELVFKDILHSQDEKPEDEEKKTKNAALTNKIKKSLK